MEHRPGAGLDPAGERAEVRGGQVVGDGDDVGRRRDRVRGEGRLTEEVARDRLAAAADRARLVEAAAEEVVVGAALTVARGALAAIRAAPAGAEAHHHPLADLEPAHPLADRGDPADALVAEHRRERRAEVVVLR
ncbi:MAG: hypothetical protein R3A79_08480 [Nannocystaceae bacterium]